MSETKAAVLSDAPTNKVKYEHFYKRPEWGAVRYLALRRDDFACVACGRARKDGVRLQVDHIKPLSVYPELALSLDNLQTMCKSCNLNKSNVYVDNLISNMARIKPAVVTADDSVGQNMLDQLCSQMGVLKFSDRATSILNNIKDRAFSSLSSAQKSFVKALYSEWAQKGLQQK